MASSKTSILILALIMFSLFSFCEAKNRPKHIPVEIRENSWTIPLETDIDGYPKEIDFIVGDFLVWKYEDGKTESVLEVTKEDYDACNTSQPIKAYNDCNMNKVELTRDGPFYFISGAEGHCEKGAKAEVFAEEYMNYYWRWREEMHKRFRVSDFRWRRNE